MLNRAFIAADCLANQWQQRWHLLRINDLKRLAGFRIHRIGDWPRPGSLFALTVVAALFLALSSEIPEAFAFGNVNASETLTRCLSAICFLIYGICLIVGLLRLIMHRARLVETRHQDYRLLAEGLRIQFFWSSTAPYAMSEANAMRSYVADHIPIARRASMFWVRGALHAVRFAFPPPRGVAESDRETAKREWDAIDPCLIAHQLAYEKNLLIERREIALHRLQEWSRVWLVSFLVFFLLLFARACLQLIAPHLHYTGEFLNLIFAASETRHVFAIAMVVSLVISLSAREVAEGFGLEAEVRRGESTSAILAAAKKHWENKSIETAEPGSSIFRRHLASRELLLFEMGRLLIDDYSDWFNIHRERPAQPVHG